MAALIEDERVDMKELADYSEGPGLAAANWKNTPGPAHISLVWENDAHAVLPPIWFRDHCPCDECRHSKTRERLFKIVDTSIGVPTIEHDRSLLKLTWSDGHISYFDSVWLYQRRPGKHDFSQMIPEVCAWQDDFLPTHISHADFMGGADGQRRWLEALIRDGLVLLDDGPIELEEVVRIAESIGPLRPTNFGSRFDVQSKPDPNNAAYTASELEFHTDLPNWRNPPDIQLLYCLENDAQGGASILCDGIAVAEDLRREMPEHFALLAEIPIDFRFQDATSDISVREPVIRIDADGRIREVRFNNWIRDAIDITPDRLEDWYTAYCNFWTRLRQPRYRHDFELQPGQMMAFDNRRVLHGRSEFRPNSGKRHLQGCYLDYDMVESRLRVMARSS